MSTFNHTSNNNGHAATGARVTGALTLGQTGTVTSLTCSQLPAVRDVVVVYDGPLAIAQLVFTKADDAAKVNVAQTIGKPYSHPHGLVLHVLSDGGPTGTYALAYS